MAVLDMIVLVGLILQNPSTLESQGTPPTPPAPSAPPTASTPGDPSLGRIRVRLAEPPPIALPPTPSLFSRSQEKPVFQVHIQEQLMPQWDWLDDGTSIPDYIHPTFPPTHHEFMLMVTPEVFRAVSVHPYGVPVLSIGRVVAKAARRQIRQFKEARARKEVEESLAAFVAAAAKHDDR